MADHKPYENRRAALSGGNLTKCAVSSVFIFGAVSAGDPLSRVRGSSPFLPLRPSDLKSSQCFPVRAAPISNVCNVASSEGRRATL